MSLSETEKCLAHPKFQQLVRSRSRFSFLFSLIITLGYAVYVIGMSFMPHIMARPLTEGGSTTYGILIAIAVIISGMVCSGFYTWWANRKFDALRNELLKDLGYE